MGNMTFIHMGMRVIWLEQAIAIWKVATRYSVEHIHVPQLHLQT